jgi:hypothetical protein
MIGTLMALKKCCYRINHDLVTQDKLIELIKQIEVNYKFL